MNTTEVLRIAAEAGMVTGDHLRFREGQRYRSLGVPSNVREEHLLNFANAIAEAERKRMMPPGSAAEALDDALVIAHIGTLESFADGRQALSALLAWEHQVSVDPAVSEDARLLVKREREACAQVCLDFAANDKLSNYGLVLARRIRERGKA